MVEFIGNYLVDLLLVGCQFVELEDFGGSLCFEVKVQVKLVIDIVLDYFVKFGVELICQVGKV